MWLIELSEYQKTLIRFEPHDPETTCPKCGVIYGDYDYPTHKCPKSSDVNPTAKTGNSDSDLSQ